MVHQCPEYANLQELQLTLQTLSDLTKTMLDAFHGNDHKLSLAWTRNSKPLSVAKSASSAHSASTLKITSAAERKRRNRIEKSRLRSLNKMAGLPKQNARKPLFRFTRIYIAHAFDRGDRTARLCHSAGPTRRLLFAAQRAQAPAIEFK